MSQHQTKRGEPMEWLRLALTADTDECNPFPFSTDKKGYGRIYDPATGRPRLATHVVLELAGSTRPSGDHMALHSCDNPPCVNPAHLRWGTAVENTEDMMRRGRGKWPAAKLTDDDVREIRRLRGVIEGREIADRFGVSAATVSEIQLRRKRKDVA